MVPANEIPLQAVFAAAFAAADQKASIDLKDTLSIYLLLARSLAMNDAYGLLIALFRRPGSRPRLRQVTGCQLSAGSRHHRSRGELLEAVRTATNACQCECPSWLIAAIDDCERRNPDTERICFRRSLE